MRWRSGGQGTLGQHALTFTRDLPITPPFPPRQHDVERFAKGNPDASLEVLDIEDLVRLGTQRQLCPFLLSK